MLRGIPCPCSVFAVGVEVPAGIPSAKSSTSRFCIFSSFAFFRIPVVEEGSTVLAGRRHIAEEGIPGARSLAEEGSNCTHYSQSLSRHCALPNANHYLLTPAEGRWGRRSIPG